MNTALVLAADSTSLGRQAAEPRSWIVGCWIRAKPAGTRQAPMGPARRNGFPVSTVLASPMAAVGLTTVKYR